MVRRIIIAAFILFAYFIPYVFINSALLTSFSLEVRASNVIIIVQDSTHIFNNELHSFIHSFWRLLLRGAPSPVTDKKRTSERCKIWKGGPSTRNAAQSGDHSKLTDPQPKRPFCVCVTVSVVVFCHLNEY